MIDPVERLIWFLEYQRASREVAPHYPTKIRNAWARSMSLIAEQFAPNDGDELVDA
jgi:hypothetical protein